MHAYIHTKMLIKYSILLLQNSLVNVLTIYVGPKWENISHTSLPTVIVVIRKLIF